MTTQLTGQLVHQISVKLEDPTGKRFSADKLYLWVSEAVIDIARRSEALMTEQSIAVTNGTQAYTAPVDVVRVHRVAYIPTGQTQEYDLQYMAYKNMSNVSWTGLRSSKGTPSIYWTWGYPPNLQINLYPVPSQNGTIKVSYFRVPASFTIDTSDIAFTSVDLPQGWDDLIIDYVVAEALMIDRDPRADMYKQRYNERLSAMAEAASSFVDQAGSIVEAGNYIPQWLYNPYGDW